MVSSAVVLPFHGLFSSSMGNIPPWYTGWDYAYLPRGAASLAASYVNLIAPGVGDLPGTGVLPTWDPIYGWTFDGLTTYLQTGLIPTSTWSMLLWLNNSRTTPRVVAGCQGAGNTRFYIAPYVTASTQFGQGNFINVAGPSRSGSLGISGQQGYKNGLPYGGTIGAGTNPGFEIYIGARNSSGVASQFLLGSVQAIAFKSGIVSAQTMLDSHNRLLSLMNGGTFCAIGDSITAGTGASDEAHRWVNIVAASKGWLLSNDGIGGTICQNTIQNSVPVIGGPATNNGRDSFSLQALAQVPPGRITIMYGTNDLRLNDVAITVANYQNDLGEIVAGIIANGLPASSITIGSPPYMASYVFGAPWDGGSAVKHVQYVAAAAVVAAAYGTRYIDVYQWMVDHGGPALIGPDNVHPNDAGHAEIAAAFLSVM